MSVVAAELGLRFGDGPFLFRNLSFVIDRGSVVAVTGPSGSGKSSLLRIIAGWTASTEGQVVLPVDATISWIFQNPEGMPCRSAIDHVVLPLMAKGATRAAAEDYAKDLLRQFKLERLGHRAFAELSGGEAQRLMLTRTLAFEPDILLVDEPTAQLDSAASKTVIDTLRLLSGQGRIVVIATHDELVKRATDYTIDLST